MRGEVHITKPVVRRKPNLSLVKFRLMAFLAVLGPGFITANVDNDPGGILTYSQAGAKYGYTLLWTLIPTTIALIVVQEMAARMGAVTGKGLSDLIREEFGLRATFITMAILVHRRFRQHRRRVRRHRLRHGGLRRQQILGSSGRRGAGLDRDRERPLQAGRAHDDFVFADLFHISGLGVPGQAGLEPRAARYADPAIPWRFAISADGRRLGRHHHHAVDAVLPASLDRRKGSRPAPLRAHPPGRDSGLRRHRRDRLLHRGGLRRHHL